MFKKILFVLMTIALFLAHAGVASACLVTGYQPRVPESLLK